MFDFILLSNGIVEEHITSSPQNPNGENWYAIVNQIHKLHLIKNGYGCSSSKITTSSFNIKLTDFYDNDDNLQSMIPIEEKTKSHFRSLHENHQTILKSKQQRSNNKIPLKHYEKRYFQQYYMMKNCFVNDLEFQRETEILNNIENELSPRKFRVYNFYNMEEKKVRELLFGHETLTGSSNVISFEKDYEIKTTTTQCRIYSNTVDFGWGLDMIDSSTLQLDNKYCPGYPAAGEGSSVFIFDTGFLTSNPNIQYPNHINRSNIIRIFDDHYNGDYASDLNGHGTHVASIIVSSIFGVASKSKALILKVLNDNGSGSFSNIVNGLLLLYTTNTYRNGIISMSLGLYLGDGIYSSPSSTIDSLIELLINEKNFIVVVAAGNDGKNACSQYPANVPGVVSIGASNLLKNKATFSNFGTCVTAFAPGEQILALSVANQNGTTNLATINNFENVFKNKRKSMNGGTVEFFYSDSTNSTSSDVNGVSLEFTHNSETFIISNKILSGTSQATPFFSGYYALLRAHYGQEVSFTQIKSLAMQNISLNRLGNIGVGSPNKFLYVGNGNSQSSIVPSPPSPPPPSSPPPNMVPPSNVNTQEQLKNSIIFIFLVIVTTILCE